MTRAELEARASDYADQLKTDNDTGELSWRCRNTAEKSYIAGFLAGRDTAVEVAASDYKTPHIVIQEIKELGEGDELEIR